MNDYPKVTVKQYTFTDDPHPEPPLYAVEAEWFAYPTELAYGDGPHPVFGDYLLVPDDGQHLIIRRDNGWPLVEKLRAAYPREVFPDPPPAKHGNTVDRCSARAARAVLDWLEVELDALLVAQEDTDDE